LEFVKCDFRFLVGITAINDLSLENITKSVKSWEILLKNLRSCKEISIYRSSGKKRFIRSGILCRKQKKQDSHYGGSKDSIRNYQTCIQRGRRYFDAAHDERYYDGRKRPLHYAADSLRKERVLSAQKGVYGYAV